MLDVDVTFSNTIAYRYSLPTSMPPLFQNFKVEKTEDINRHLEWPVEATRAKIVYTVEREVVEKVRVPAKVQEGYEDVEC